MKKNIFLIIIIIVLFAVGLYAADTDAAAPKQVSTTSTTGVGFINAASAVTYDNGSFGINGLAFRFLDTKRNGVEIPVSLQYTDNGTYDTAGYIKNFKTTFGISLGLRFIEPVFMTEYLRVNALPGFALSYSGSWAEGENDGPPYSTNSQAQHLFTLGLSMGIEIEVPVGKLMSMPPDTVCLSAGVSVTGSAGYSRTYANGGFQSAGYTVSVNTSSSGTSITSLGVRYYF